MNKFILNILNPEKKSIIKFNKEVVELILFISNNNKKIKTIDKLMYLERLILIKTKENKPMKIMTIELSWKK